MNGQAELLDTANRPSPTAALHQWRRGLSAMRGLAVLSLPIAVATYPLALLVAANAHTQVFAWSWLLRPAVGLAALALVVMVVYRLVTPAWTASALAAAVFFVSVLVLPAFVRQATGLWPLPPLVALALLIVSWLAGTWAGRRVREKAFTVAFAILAVGMGWNVFHPLIRTLGTATDIPPSNAGQPRVSGDRPAHRQLPDVYYIVLDGMASPDVLTGVFGVRVTPDLQALARANVSLPSRARSNYGQTYSSLASSLNGRYLDGLRAAAAADDDWRPLHALIARAAMLQRFRAVGYEFVMIGSDTNPTAEHPLADRCLCDLPSGPTELEHAVLEGGVFWSLLGADALALEGHWKSVRRQFEQVEEVRSGKPMLVFVHILAPHAPFVFDADGAYRPSQPAFSMLAGDLVIGTRSEYREAYARQASFVLHRIATLVEHLSSRPRRPVIVIHADHGSGLGLVNADAAKTDWHERLSIFSAYGGPADAPPVPPDMSPVNALSWALAAATGSIWTPAPNRSYASSYLRPYDFVEIKPAVRRLVPTPE